MILQAMISTELHSLFCIGNGKAQKPGCLVPYQSDVGGALSIVSRVRPHPLQAMGEGLVKGCAPVRRLPIRRPGHAHFTMNN